MANLELFCGLISGFLLACFSCKLGGLLPVDAPPPGAGGPLLDRNFARVPLWLTGLSKDLSPLGVFGCGVSPTWNDGGGSLAVDEPEDPKSGIPREDVGELESRGLLRIRFLGKRELKGSKFNEFVSDSCGVKQPCDLYDCSIEL